MTYSAIPDLHTWHHAIRHRHWLTVSINIIGNYGGILVVPFKFTFLRVEQDPSGDGWDLSVSGTAAVILGVIYTVYLVLGISLPLYFQNKQTGLRWDPSSLASQIGLLHQTNMRKALEGTEFLTIQELQALVQTWPSRFGNLRLGYWERRDHPNDSPVYGIHFVPGNTTSTPKSITRIVQLGAYGFCPYKGTGKISFPNQCVCLPALTIPGPKTLCPRLCLWVPPPPAPPPGGDAMKTSQAAISPSIATSSATSSSRISTLR